MRKIIVAALFILFPAMGYADTWRVSYTSNSEEGSLATIQSIEDALVSWHDPANNRIVQGFCVSSQPLRIKFSVKVDAASDPNVAIDEIRSGVASINSSQGTTFDTAATRFNPVPISE